MLCYLNPYISTEITAIILTNTTGSFWEISSENSNILANADKNLELTWLVDDKFINSLIESQRKSSKFILPTSAFKDESVYKISFEATNTEHTFFANKIIDFVPVSCHYYLHQTIEVSKLTKVIQDNAGN